jgi:N6-L-threonylcarbamoyladenine synthase
MIILGIETSCDETAAALVEDGSKVLSSVVASSQKIHKKYGGIMPEQAAREQLKFIIPVIKEVIHNSKFIIPDSIDAIAVTVGPGLIGSLLVGLETARTLAWLWKKPIIPVNHLIGHIYANFLHPQLTNLSNPNYFPALCLIVSGGHTELLLMKNHGKFQWLGGTRDDAAGECFDKCARLLGLSYPGGPAISKAASSIDNQPASPTSGQLTISNKFRLPRPMVTQDNLDFSFSGIKTAVLNLTKKQQLTTKNLNLMAFEIQEAITDVLVAKTFKAAEKYQVKSILIGGGVAANSRLREKFTTYDQKLTTKLFIPDKKFCTDNAASIASTAFFNYHPIPWQKIKADPELEII